MALCLLRTLGPAFDRALLPVVPVSRGFAKYYGKSRGKRIPLTSKQGNKNYYKGNGCRSEGRHTSKGGYVMDKSKMLELIVPDLTGFKVTS